MKVTSIFAFSFLAQNALGFLVPASFPQGQASTQSALSVSVATPVTRSTLMMKAAKAETDDLTKKISITGDNVELTPAMKEYVVKKLGKSLGKTDDHGVISADVHLKVVNAPRTGTKHSHTAEATVFFKGGHVLRASEETDFMYASIDLVSHRLARLMR